MEEKRKRRKGQRGKRTGQATRILAAMVCPGDVYSSCRLAKNIQGGR